MSDCVLTTDINNLDCSDSMGGVAEIFVSNRILVTNISIDPTGDIVDDFTFSSGGFFKYTLRDENGEFTATSAGAQTAGTHYFERQLTFDIVGLSTIKRNEIRALLKAYSIVVFKDFQDMYWLIGDNKGVHDIRGSIMQTGRAKADLSGFTVIIGDMEKDPPMQVLPSAVLNNLAP
jgi:hypothetical protein